MPNDDLWRRLEDLEGQPQKPNIPRAERLEFVRSKRSDGWTENAISTELSRRAPPPRTGGYVDLASYCYHERFESTDSDWAASHFEVLVNLVGHLNLGKLCIMSHESDERLPRRLPPTLNWRAFDPLTVEALSWHVTRPKTWRQFWSRPTAPTEDIVRYYISRAGNTTAQFIDKMPDRAAEHREEVRSRISWIESQSTRPESLPWATNPLVTAD